MTKLSDLGPPIPGTLHGGEDIPEDQHFYHAPLAGRRSISAICAMGSHGTSRWNSKIAPRSSSFLVKNKIGPAGRRRWHRIRLKSIASQPKGHARNIPPFRLFSA